MPPPSPATQGDPVQFGAQSCALDSLTGLPRGADFEERVAEAIRVAGADQHVAVLVIDVDRFQKMNELLGYQAGDTALAEFGRRVNHFYSTLPEGWMCARLGGDEFGILLGPDSRPEQAKSMAETLLQRLRVPLLIGNREIHLTASVGVGVTAGSGELEAVPLIHSAHHAMARVKRRGGNAAEMALPSQEGDLEHRFRLESDFRHAMERRELFLRYQPQVDRFGRLDGMEALLTWDHPRFGRIETGFFIALAEEIGEILPIGEWALEQALTQWLAWNGKGLTVPRVAVNVSALQITAPDFVEKIIGALERTGAPPEALELEITETSVLRDLDESARRMSRLRSVGISISMDDFGVGYSPLSYLHRLPLTSVKVDRTFVSQIAKPSGSLPVVHTITVLGHHRGLKVVAEGVETLAQLELVRAARCDRMQGYLFGPPCADTEMEALLANPQSLSLPFIDQFRSGSHS